MTLSWPHVGGPNGRSLRKQPAFPESRKKMPRIKLEVSKRERLERQTVIDLIPALFVCVLPDGPLEFGGGSWLTSRKSTGSFKVLHTSHGWRPLRVIACMPTQPSNASPGSIQIRSTKLTGAVSFWKRTEPSPQLLGKGPSQLELRIACRFACERAMAPLNASNSSPLCSRSMYRSRKGMNHRWEGVR